MLALRLASVVLGLALGVVHCSSASSSSHTAPTVSRPTASVCTATPLPSDAGATSCSSDGTCTAAFGNTGYCVHGQCSLDQCIADADCPNGEVCSCRGNTFGFGHQSYGNSCVASNCRVDSDCGVGGFCSPTFSAGGSFYGVQGYYCHTSADTCSNDADCGPASAVPAGYCAFSPDVGHWSCSYTHAAG